MRCWPVIRETGVAFLMPVALPEKSAISHTAIKRNMAAISPVHGFSRLGFSFLSLFCVLLLQSAIGQQLKFVLLVMRHGDRTPISTYPNDPHKEDTWKQGYGQLTRLGMKQQFRLGKFIRKTYSSLLSAEYLPKEIYIRSTDFDRTIMSAQANLAGLFPPNGWQIWNHKIHWQPVPVHTVPLKDEKLLHFPLRDCKRFKILLKETMGAKEVQDKVKSNMKLFATLAGHTGYDVKTLLDFNNNKLYNIYDALHVQKIHGLNLPSWATTDIMQQTGKVLMYGLTAMFGVHGREEKSRLQGGVLVKDILEKISEAAQSATKRKMIMYSAHDTTIVALLSALNVFNGMPPSYAACYFFELYQESDGGYTIKMKFRNGRDKEPAPVILPGCTEACPLEKFKQLVAPIIPDNWEDECNK
ncbi:prostatic acid phosphatase-like [Tiliqua scincoides]|uniref:prostatic acid phosphatase-like n=1 Tax=Tiliqua scincoides TaxID=71010 RepID=UPI003462683D